MQAGTSLGKLLPQALELLLVGLRLQHRHQAPPVCKRTHPQSPRLTKAGPLVMAMFSQLTVAAPRVQLKEPLTSTRPSKMQN